MTKDGVQGFVDKHQYQIMIGIFIAGMFFARTEFVANQLDAVKSDAEYASGRTKRQITNASEVVGLKTDIKMLKLELKLCKEK